AEQDGGSECERNRRRKCSHAALYAIDAVRSLAQARLASIKKSLAHGEALHHLRTVRIERRKTLQSGQLFHRQ
ncbi:MAG: hypothetical protein ACREF6_16795, partial [Alphaproteobacteria bacterium]